MSGSLDSCTVTSSLTRPSLACRTRQGEFANTRSSPTNTLTDSLDSARSSTRESKHGATPSVSPMRAHALSRRWRDD